MKKSVPLILGGLIGLLVMAGPALALETLIGDYAVHLDGTSRHGVGLFTFDGDGDVSGQWVSHFNNTPPCTETLTGTESEGPIVGSILVTATLTGSSKTRCYNGPIQLVIEPNNDNLGFFFDAVKPNISIQSGWGVQTGEDDVSENPQE